MIDRSNHQPCPVPGCQVITFTLRYQLSGIGDDTVEEQCEVASDNTWACAGANRDQCACKRHELDL